MPKNISLNDVKKYKNKFLRSNKNTASRNALIKNDLNTVALNWENFSQINHHFSHLIEKELPATNQMASGRCWGFAGLNLMRLEVVKKLGLANFEFSQFNATVFKSFFISALRNAVFLLFLRNLFLYFLTSFRDIFFAIIYI